LPISLSSNATAPLMSRSRRSCFSPLTRRHTSPARSCRWRAAILGKGSDMANKIYPSPEAALEGVLFDGMTMMSGGFGLSGNPESLIPAIRDAGVKGLTVVSNNCGADGFGLCMLLHNGQMRKMISSYVGENKLFEQLYLDGKLELELNPQGTLA